MAQAYDFALDKIGMEIMSYQVSVLTVRSTLTYSIASWTLTQNSSPSVRFGWITSISSKECKCTIYIFKTHLTVIKEGDIRHLKGSLCASLERLWGHMLRTSASQPSDVFIREAASTPWLTLSSSGGTTANMKRWVQWELMDVILVQDTQQEFRFVRRKSSSAFYW